ncbi:VQ motif-containing protein 25-like [Arachis stenosperma]|uniref:VQ motif-containing protein 25-like n=1 Tax=Arachis stenosperma TaxID=217475 RepID=UPI0025AB6B80|nr:VQ motif-containing protein 25-like [Arachis stenosperma]
MENKAKKDSSHVHRSLHEDSHTICKANYKPKIRIIHIYAPEIIKTDVENFRELVQKLTGKPTREDQSIRKKKKKKQPSTTIRKEKETISRSTSGNDNGVLENNPTKKMELRNDDSDDGGGVWGLDEKVKEEEVGSFRDGGGFSDLEGFISELFPLDATHHMQGFVEKLYA